MPCSQSSYHLKTTKHRPFLPHHFPAEYLCPLSPGRYPISYSDMWHWRYLPLFICLSSSLFFSFKMAMCMHVGVYTVSTCVCVFMCMNVVCVHACLYVCVCAYVCMYMRVHVCVHACLCVCVCVLVLTRTFLHVGNPLLDYLSLLVAFFNFAHLRELSYIASGFPLSISWL